MDFRRPQAAILARRLEEPRRFIQAAAGECELFYWRERNYEAPFRPAHWQTVRWLA